MARPKNFTLDKIQAIGLALIVQKAINSGCLEPETTEGGGVPFFDLPSIADALAQDLKTYLDSERDKKKTVVNE